MKINCYHSYLLVAFALCYSGISIYAQKQPSYQKSVKNTFVTTHSAIENIGQYGQFFKGHEEMGAILFGYEGMDAPVLFTKKGLIHLHQRALINNLSNKMISRAITMQWLNANLNAEIIATEKTDAYHTYGLLTKKAHGYKKITYKNLYNGIDLVYDFGDYGKPSFEYTLVINAGANIQQIKMAYNGDVKRVTKSNDGKLFISSDINVIEATVPKSYYSNDTLATKKEDVSITYNLNANEVSFNLPINFNDKEKLIIDPFISNTTNLNGTNAEKAKDVDFDYAGNVYVTGGGDVTTNHRLAKYDVNGVLQWTFNGVLTVPVWEFGQYNGGWVVEKQTGKIYLGQGNRNGQREFIRLNTNGLYDNFIVSNNNTFNMWKMYWNCNNGNPEIWSGSGSVTSNVTYMVFTPPAQIYSFYSTTQSFNSNQNVVDFLFDPLDNSIYSIFACSVGAPVDNTIYKNPTPITGTVTWSTNTGYSTLVQEKNRPYLVANPVRDNSENSANILALNTTYLFYWDGKNLQAHAKSTGAITGTSLVTSNTEKMQGGIYADGCNNVFVGSTNGTVKVYNFNGSSFNDAPPDIVIPGFGTKEIYDIAFDDARNLLYVCGNGFVTAIDISSYNCNTNNFFTLTTAPNCTNASVTATITPSPPASTIVTYYLYIGNTQIANNTTGIFTGLVSSPNYKIIAILNETCSGLRLTSSFSIATPTLTTSLVNTSCGNNNGQITAVASGSVAPYTYSINGVNFFSSGIFNNLPPNNYTVTAKDGNGCIINSPTLQIQSSSLVVASPNSTNTICGSNNGSITIAASGGSLPYLYSIDNGLNYQALNVFNGLAAQSYTVKVKDNNGCSSNAIPVLIQSSVAINVSVAAVNTTCNLNNGSITITANGGNAPYTFSIDNGLNYLSSTIFNALPAQTYIVKVKDALGCISNATTAIIQNSIGISFSATASNTTCNLDNGSIAATVLAGTPPYQYSITGNSGYQSQNIFTNLAATNYLLSVKDANGCTNSSLLTVGKTPTPTLNVFAGNDTLVRINTSIPLNAFDVNNVGFVKYEWLPNYGLTNNQIKNPTAKLDRDVIAYTLTATTANGCVATDVIEIKTFAVAEIYVPKAFTPNKDGINDVLRPTLFGIKKLNQFAIYNRYGELVYRTTTLNAGWNGFINGAVQNTGTYIWIIEAIDSLGRQISEKGSVLLIK
jgi:gliding motility-associated-like protein